MKETALPEALNPFGTIQQYIEYINKRKTVKMFDKVELHLQEGDARFIDPHTAEISGKKFTAKRIFIAAGTRPAIPPIPKIETADCLTNEDIFELDEIPDSTVIIGGGATGCEMPCEDYSAAVAEKADTGFIKVYCSAAGRIYGITIAGEDSGNMINERVLAILKKDVNA